MADAVPGEMYTLDNKCSNGTILVTVPGDINGDYKVNMKDLYACLILHFGCEQCILCYIPNYDVNSDGKINMTDIYIAIQHFGETWKTQTSKLSLLFIRIQKRALLKQFYANNYRPNGR